MRGWIVAGVLIAVALAAVPPLLIARARIVKSLHPRVHLIPDMDTQPKLKAQQASSFFEDGRAMRMPVPNTVAHGELHADTHLHTGKIADGWATTFPIPITHEVMQRGRERFDITCTPCHGSLGFGDGPVSNRANELGEGTWVPPISFHQDDVRGRAVGELYDTITSGVRTMPAYGPQITVEDRWAIVAYVRALQRSQNATMDDVPPETRSELE